MEVYVAHFECVECGFVWHAQAGPTQCPLCDHLYVNWKNYPIERPNWCRVCKVEFK